MLSIDKFVSVFTRDETPKSNEMRLMVNGSSNYLDKTQNVSILDNAQLEIGKLPKWIQIFKIKADTMDIRRKHFKSKELISCSYLNSCLYVCVFRQTGLDLLLKADVHSFFHSLTERQSVNLYDSVLFVTIYAFLNISVTWKC